VLKGRRVGVGATRRLCSYLPDFRGGSRVGGIDLGAECGNNGQRDQCGPYQNSTVPSSRL